MNNRQWRIQDFLKGALSPKVDALTYCFAIFCRIGPQGACIPSGTLDPQMIEIPQHAVPSYYHCQFLDKIFFILIYRPRSREGNVFTGMCHSVHRMGCVSQHAL